MTNPGLVMPRIRQPLGGEELPRTWREKVAVFRYLPRLLRLVWETHRPLTLAMIVLRVLRGFIPIAALWVGKLIVDAVVGAANGTVDTDLLWRYVAIELAIGIVGEILARTSALVESLLGDLFSNHISVRLMQHAATLDLAQFEDPAFYDHLERARQQTTGRIALIAQLLGMAQDSLTLLTLGGALVVHNPWLMLLLAAAVLPSFLGETHFAALSYSLLFRRTPERRELDYLRFVGASDETAKEVQMFGLAPWLTERYRVLAQKFYEENRNLSLRRGFVSAALSILGTIGYYAAYAIILIRAVRGDITIGMLTFLAASFARGRD